MNVYLASSWKHPGQPKALYALRKRGHIVYDFRNEESKFVWSQIRPAEDWTGETMREALHHPLADLGFAHDMNALRWCDVCVLLLPCGKSAHLELGWAAGAGKRTIVLLPPGENPPDLMYRIADRVCVSMDEVIETLRAFSVVGANG